MDYILEMKSKNITFDKMDESQAMEIMRNRYSFYQLFSYTCLFETYHSTERQGQYLHLDFSQLVYLAEIDSRLGQVLMNMCMELEDVLKARLSYDVNRVCDANRLVREYCDVNKEYLQSTYTSENMDCFRYQEQGFELADVTFVTFLNTVQFGTLERLIHFFYQRYAEELYCVGYVPCEAYLSSTRRIRNIVAHNNSILNKLNDRTDYQDCRMRAFLGKAGIKNRILTTNLSRFVVNDLCAFFELYFSVVGSLWVQDAFRCLDQRIQAEDYSTLMNNDTLASVYRFVKAVLQIYIAKLEH